MKRTTSVILVAGLVVAAFAAGYAGRPYVGKLIGRGARVRAVAQNQQQNQPQSQQALPGRKGNRARTTGGKGMLTGVIQTVQADKITLTVQGTQGTSIQPGSTLSVNVAPTIQVTRQINVSDLKSGDVLTVRGTEDGSRFVALAIRVEK